MQIHFLFLNNQLKLFYKMKKIFPIALVIAFVFSKNILAQSVHSCCVKPATAEFAMLGKEDGFKSAHLSPLPFNYVPHGGKIISIKTPDGKDTRAFEIKPREPSKNFLFVFHEWWGLNDYIKQEAERLFHELPGVTVIALDCYDGKVATTADSASKLMQNSDVERIKNIIKGAIEYAGTEAHIQTIGWCFGGGWSLQASLLARNQGTGCVMYYGMPEKNVNKLEKLNAPVLGLFSETDEWITKDLVNDFEAVLRRMNKLVTIRFFKAPHAFANPSNPKYNAEVAAEANKLALEFLKKNLK